MKKALLFAAAVIMAATASAEGLPAGLPQAQPIGENDVDVTPAGYHFHKYGKFVGYQVGESAGDWNMDAHSYKKAFIDEEGEFGDGQIVVLGAFNHNAEAVEKLAAATQIIDLGGTTGKVLAINHNGSKFAEAYKKVTGQDIELAQAPGGHYLLFFHLDHNKLMKYVGDADGVMPLRIRMELNMFSNVQTGLKNAAGQDVEYWKTYVNDDENNVRPKGHADNAASGINVHPSEFAYRWCEMDDEDPTDTSVWDDGDNGAEGEWNPNRWMVYEWDLNMANVEEGEPYKYNLKIKNENPGNGSVYNYTMLIRDITVYVPEKTDREYIVDSRPRTWNLYTTGAPASVESVAVDAEALTYTVDGGMVSFSAPVKVYNMAGMMVAEGQHVNLAHGVYVAQAGAQTVKIAVK